MDILVVCFIPSVFTGDSSKSFITNTQFRIFIKFILLFTQILVMAEINNANLSNEPTSSEKLQEMTSSIEEEVARIPTESSSLTTSVQDKPDFVLTSWTSSISADDKIFEEMVVSVREAIATHVIPERIRKGTSGSYFVKNSAGKIVGVFKPSDEEQY